MKKEDAETCVDECEHDNDSLEALIRGEDFVKVRIQVAESAHEYNYSFDPSPSIFPLKKQEKTMWSVIFEYIILSSPLSNLKIL